MTVPFVDLPRLLQPIREDLIDALTRVLDSGVFVQGPEGDALERELCDAWGVSHALAVNSGTAALHLALAACGVGPGDEVVTVANTFIATAEAISQTGAQPVFADIVEGGYCLDPVAFERAITPRTRAVVPVHLYGEVADMDAILAIARKHGLFVVEDACQAHGARRNGRLSGTFGDAGCFSFYPTKNLGTVGEGGLVVTNNAHVAERVMALRNHGQRERHRHVVAGYNDRLPELQAAALRLLLPRLPEWNAARVELAGLYGRALASSEVSLPRTPGDGSHVYHLYVVRSKERDALQACLRERGIATAVHYPTPIHLQPAYLGVGGGAGSLPRTEAAVREILSLPMHPGMTEREVLAVAGAVRDFAANPRGAAAEKVTA